MNPQTSKKSIAPKIIIISLIAFVVLSLVGVGAFVSRSALYCSNDTAAVNKKLMPIQQQLSAMPISPTNLRVAKASDCLTGGGIHIEFTVQKQYASPEQAEKDIIANLSAARIATPDPSQSTTYLDGVDGNVSGGATTIKQIQLSYSSDKGADYEFTFYLAEPIPCLVQNNKVLCGGEDKDVMLKKAFASHSVVSTEVSATL